MVRISLMSFRRICIGRTVEIVAMFVLLIMTSSYAVENHVMISWGDQIVTCGPGTDAALDSPQAIDAVMARLKGRGFTGIAWRADLLDSEPSSLCLNDTSYVGALIVHRVQTICNPVNLLQYARQSAERNGLEFWVWVPTVYSDGSPQSAPTLLGPFTLEHRYVREHPEVLVVSRDGIPYYGQREYAYAGARADKVQEMVYFAQHWGIKNIIACMRSESSQYQLPPDKADRYGFNQPIVDEMLSRYSIDIMTNPKFDVNNVAWNPTDIDVQKWHDLRGEYLTQFYSDLRRALNAVDPNIRVGVMIPGGDYIGAVIGNIRVDWRKWIDQGLVNEFILPQTLAATEDWDSPTKGYLTDGLKAWGSRNFDPLTQTWGNVDLSTFRSYADSSAHPETRFLQAGGDRYHMTAPSAGMDGWRTWWDQDSFDLGWYQRWLQWKKDILDFGHIKFFNQNFDDFPEYSSGRSKGWGDYQYQPSLRYCPGLWWPLGDGTDAYATAQSTIANSGRAIKLSRGRDFYVRHLTSSGRSYWSIDQSVMSGNCKLDFWLYRPATSSNPDVYLTQDLNTITGFGLHFLASNIKYDKYVNGAYTRYSPSPAVAWPVNTWQKFSIQVNLDNKTYSAYAGPNNEMAICTNAPYSPAVSYFNMLDFSLQGATGAVCYLDDLSMEWTPTLYYAHKGKYTYISDDFESHTAQQTVHDTQLDVGSVWQVVPSTQASLFKIETSLSYGDGWKCMTSPLVSDGTVISSNDGAKLVIQPGNIITIDLDMFVEKNKSTIFGMAKSSGGPETAVVKVDGNGEVWCWSGGGYIDSGKSVKNAVYWDYFGIWNHFQIAMNSATRTYTVVVQESGSMPFVVGTFSWGSETQVSDGVVFKISCLGTFTGSYPYVYYDNIEIHYGMPDECGDENHPYPAGDFSQNCKVDNEDLWMFACNWLGTGPVGNMNNNEIVSFEDFALFSANWLAAPYGN